MAMNRIKTLITALFLLSIYTLFLSFPVHAASRGITVKAKTSSGATKEMELYSGYYAFVVGCGDYRSGWPTLPNPIKDAREVAKTLRQMGWEVETLENPDGSVFRRSLNKLIAGPGKDKEKGILLWFSGHGHTMEEADGLSLGYLVPVDAPDPDIDEVGFMDKSISMRQIETVAKRIHSKHVLMVFDSCFSGAIFQMTRAKPSPYIQEKVAEPVRQFITAGGEDEQVPDRSVFKDVFLQAIHKGYADRNDDGYITGEELGSYLQEKVVNYSNKSQHPQFGKINNPKLDKGDFVFIKQDWQKEIAKIEIPPKKKKPEHGLFILESKPMGAEVWISGKKRGTTPLRLKVFESGDLTVSIRKDGFKTKKKKIYLITGEETQVSLTLDRIKKHKRARSNVRRVPPPSF